MKDPSRREFLRGSAGAMLGASAFRGVFDNGHDGGGVVSPLHHRPRAKRVVFLCMAGGPSQLETLDYKPKLAAMDGKPMPASFTAGQPIAQLQGHKLRCLGPQAKFRRCGDSGQEISDYLPFLQGIADRICIVRSLKTTQINHDPAHTVMNTGTSISGRPSMGSWVQYALGSESSSLPGFVVMSSVGGRNPQPIAARQWAAGFLPSRFQGVEFYSHGDPVHYVTNSAGVGDAEQDDVVATIRALDRLEYERSRDPETLSRIAQYELARRMQDSIPELMNFADEPEHVRALYGVDRADGSFAANCLVARRLLERGVRFVQLYHRGWDHHGGLNKFMGVCSRLCDRPSAALVADLAQRGMLEDTLVVWGGEFGRTPMFQGNKGGAGRDHHIAGFSMWLAGGGVQGGLTHGATDELGYHAVEDVVEVHDLHATILYTLGIDHERLTIRAQGRDHRLTDVHGHVVHPILE